MEWKKEDNVYTYDDAEIHVIGRDLDGDVEVMVFYNCGHFYIMASMFDEINKKIQEITNESLRSD